MYAYRGGTTNLRNHLLAKHSSIYFTSLLQQQYLSCKEVSITKFEKEAIIIALTTDIWTSQAVEAYITVTTHYLDPSWKMQSYVLQASAFPERHTGIEKLAN